ncbi:MAG: hypothetical protein U1E15_06255 [Hyphomicrobiales bacterium]
MPDDVYTIGLNRAVDLLAEALVVRLRGAVRGRCEFSAPILDGGGNVEIMGGRYGAQEVRQGECHAAQGQDAG